jgi:ribosomal protein S18 acetylase RimI-like enzyme
MEIVRADRRDAEAVLQLQRLAYASEARLYNDWTIPPLRQTLAELLRDFETMTILKAVRNGRIVGSVRGRVVDGICEVGRLIVAPDCQRQGIGSALLQAIETACNCASEVAAFELFTGSLSEGNLRLYRRHGYVPERERVLSPQVTTVYLRKKAWAFPSS